MLLEDDTIKLIREKFERAYSMDEDQQHLVFKYAQKVPKGGVVLDLGVCNGGTSAIFVLLSKERVYEYHGVDNFSLTQNGDIVKAKLDSLGIEYNLHFTSTQALVWDKKVDLLCIDAGHDERNVMSDCKKYVPFVKRGGIVMFHDYDEKPTTKEESAHWAVRFYADKMTKLWEDVEYLRGLKIRRRPL